MATRFSIGQRVTATVHGVTLYGTAAKIDRYGTSRDAS